VIAVRRWFYWLPSALLAGCAVMPPEQQATEPASYRQHLESLSSIRDFSLSGRIGVQAEGKGFSGSLYWRHGDLSDNIAIYSPLGSQIAQIDANGDEVKLIADKKTYTAADAETLTEQTLGWRLPVTGLHDWVLGRPTAVSAEILAWDDSGHITRLRQSGWEIEYQNYTVAYGRQLPGKIVLKSAKLDLKLVVDQWEANSVAQ